MKRNCCLDLRLHSSTAHYSLSSSRTSLNGKRNNIPNKHLVLIHDGHHCIFDVTELKARVIIWLASREMKERIGLQPQALSMYVSRGLSMKRSLQNFLQKRKKRSQIKAATLPL